MQRLKTQRLPIPSLALHTLAKQERKESPGGAENPSLGRGELGRWDRVGSSLQASDHSNRRTLWAGTCAPCEAHPPSCRSLGLRQASGHTQASLLSLLPSELPLCWAGPLTLSRDWKAVEDSGPFWASSPSHFPQAGSRQYLHPPFLGLILNQQHCWCRRRRAAGPAARWSWLWVGGEAPGDVEG